MTNTPQVVTPQEAQRVMDEHHEETGPRDDMWSRCAAGCAEWSWDEHCEPWRLAHTVATEPERIAAAERAAVVKALEALLDVVPSYARPAIRHRLNAIENGAPL